MECLKRQHSDVSTARLHSIVGPAAAGEHMQLHQQAKAVCRLLGLQAVEEFTKQLLPASTCSVDVSATGGLTMNQCAWLSDRCSVKGGGRIVQVGADW